MISQTAINNYLNRQLKSWEFVKSWSDTETDIALSQLNPQPYFYTKPMLHQKLTFLLCTLLPEMMQLLDLGLGKSKVILDIVNYRKLCGEPAKTLVLVPNLVLIDSWKTECEIHAPNLKVVALTGNKEERLVLIKRQADVYIINYAGLVSLATDFEINYDRIRHNNKKPRKKEHIVNREKIRELGVFDLVVLDESTEVKNHNTITYKVCKEVMKPTKGRFGLTGTPFGRHPEDLWPQFFLVDRGQTLGNTLGIFRETFFNIKPGYFGGIEYKIKKPLEQKLHEVIKHRSIRFTEAECLKLPPKIYTVINTSFSTDAVAYYNKVVMKIREAKGNVVMMRNAFCALRQLTSGFLTMTDDLTKEKERVSFDENPKLDALEELMTRLPEGKKAIIFHEYIYTGEMISGLLTKMGIKHDRLYGETKDRGGVLNRFLHDDNYTTLVVNHETGGFGLNLQVANYVIFYESPVSPIVRQQTEKRAHRNGQEATVFIYDLIVKRSIDAKILSFLKQGKELFKAIVDGKETLELYD